MQIIDRISTCADEPTLRYSDHAQNQNRTKTDQARKRSAAQAQTLASYRVLQGRGAICSRVYRPGKGRQIRRAATKVSGRKDRAGIASRLTPLFYGGEKIPDPPGVVLVVYAPSAVKWDI